MRRVRSHPQPRRESCYFPDMTHLLAAVLAASLLSPAVASPDPDAPDGWVLMEAEAHPEWGQVIARHKPLDGADCLEISGVSAADPELLKAIILDIPGNLQWSSAGLALSEVLGPAGDGFDYLQVLKVPPPFSDRYWVLRGTVAEGGEGPGSWAFHWSRVDAAQTYPERVTAIADAYGQAVEIGVNVGSWALLPEGDATRARFRSCTNIGGGIPEWAGEKAARLLLPNNLRDLFAEAQRRSQGG